MFWFVNSCFQQMFQDYALIANPTYNFTQNAINYTPAWNCYAFTTFLDLFLISNTKSKPHNEISGLLVCSTDLHKNALIHFAIAQYLSLEEQSIWASQTRVFPSNELPACPGGHTEDWSAVDAPSGSPSEEPSVHTAELDTSTKKHLWCHFPHWAYIKRTNTNKYAWNCPHSQLLTHDFHDSVSQEGSTAL